MNRRPEIAMTPTRWRLSSSGSRTVALSTIDGNGHPDSVKWFTRVAGLLRVTSVRKARKAVSLRRNPKVASLTGSGTQFAELRGLVIRGVAS